MSASAKSRIKAAAELNRLAHNLLAYSGDEESVATVQAQVEQLADMLELSEARRRDEDADAAPQFMERLLVNPGQSLVAEGQAVDVFGDSPVSGPFNPFTTGLSVRREGNEAVGSVTLGPAWEGAPGRSHGGIVASLVDETMGCLLPIIGTLAFTGTLELTYRAPCPLRVPLEFRAGLTDHAGRKLFLSCIGTGPDGVFVEAKAVFISVATD